MRRVVEPRGVDSTEFQLHPVGPLVLGGLVIHPLAGAREVLRFYRDVCKRPAGRGRRVRRVADRARRQSVLALLLGYNGPLDEGERVLAPARAFGSPVADWLVRCHTSSANA